MVDLFADLRIELHSTRGDATARLHGTADGLAIDIDQPIVLARALSPGRHLTLPPPVADIVADTPIIIRTRGRNIAGLAFTGDGNVRVRPTLVGVRTLGAAVLAGPYARATALGGTLASALFAARWVSRNRGRKRR